MIIKRFTISIVLVTAALTASGQYFQYSQYNFTTQRINPAMVATSNYASVGMLYRNQATGGDFNLNSNILSLTYPILSRKDGHRWSGVGISLMDDRVGGIFSTQEASASYAVNIFLSKFKTLTLGFKGLYQQRKINLDGLFTGSQYIPDRGFDQTIFNGENMQLLQTSFFTFSSGIYWQEVDKKGNRLAYWGVSLFDFNKPDESFTGSDNQLSSTLIVTGGVRIFQKEKISFMPEVLLTRNAGNHVFNVGGITSYVVAESKNKPDSRIDIITKYVFGRSGILGLQLHRENISIGCSYDFPILKVNVGNMGAFEVAIELRRLVEPKFKRRTTAVNRKPAGKNVPANSTTKPVQKASKTSPSDSLKTKPVSKDLRTSLKAKQDSVIARAEAGRIRHEPLVVEKITLHFNFEFNSSDLDEESKKYLDDLMEALKENEHLRIKLTGHTDNVGSAKFNQRLSLYRANTIKDYLTSKGIDAGRIDAEGRGLHEPLNDNKTEGDRAKNRRVELVIFYTE